jgi:hypothetical protein
LTQLISSSLTIQNCWLGSCHHHKCMTSRPPLSFCGAMPSSTLTKIKLNHFMACTKKSNPASQKVTRGINSKTTSNIAPKQQPVVGSHQAKENRIRGKGRLFLMRTLIMWSYAGVGARKRMKKTTRLCIPKAIGTSLGRI